MARNLPEKKADFIEPMECLPVDQLPDGAGWLYELKLDGYRLQAVKGRGAVALYSRLRKNLNSSFQYLADDLAYLPDNTVLDGELVALSDEGKFSFNLLQNFRSGRVGVTFYVFDILLHQGRDLLKVPLSARRALVAKRADSIYEPGLHTGLWRKQRMNRSQEFVVGGYIPGSLGVDSLVIGVYRRKDLHYVARACAGFVAATRREVSEQLAPLITMDCPFVNLPEAEPGRWGQGLTAEKMRECVWVKPLLMAEVESLEWTGADHLRHTKFIRLRDDKDPRKVVRET
jgi:ATP-dependent DNA ligase